MGAGTESARHSPRWPRIGLGLAALLIGAGIPILEVNATHVFNPAWPAHARLHEVWQLITHSLLMAYCLRSLSAQDDARRPAAIILMVSGGFCAAVALQETYGGSMRHTDGTELAWLGVNVAVLVMGAIMLFSLLVLIHARARR